MNFNKSLPRIYTQFGPETGRSRAQFLYTVCLYRPRNWAHREIHHAQNLCALLNTICLYSVWPLIVAAATVVEL